jgi:hypothetical protein
MIRRSAVLVAALVLAPAAFAAVPAKGAKFKGTESTTTMVIAKAGRAIATLKLGPKRAPAACRLKNPTLTAIPIKASGTFVYKGTVPSASGKKINLIVKGSFATDYLATLSVTYAGAGCSFAYGDSLTKL